MTRSIIIILNIFLCSFFITANNLSGGFTGEANVIELENGKTAPDVTSFYFEKNTYELSLSNNFGSLKDKGIPKKLWGEDEEYFETGKWFINETNNFIFLCLESNQEFTFKPKLGMLFHPRRLFLYDNDKLFFASNEGFRFDGTMPRVISTKMSSVLVEGKKTYEGKNFIFPFKEQLSPWVEGKADYGLGEWIELETDSYQFPVDFFLISNGYVSFNKPYLYKYNSRIKKLKISCDEHNIEFEVELKDTPNFQEIRLPKKINDKTTTFRFTILEVYPGTKWKDTCLNLIIPLGDLP